MLNRYPLWKNLLIIIVLIICSLLALPNLYGEDPSVQISPTRTTKIDDALVSKIEGIIKDGKLEYKRIDRTDQQLLIRFKDTEEQLMAKDLIASHLQRDYVTALNLAPDMPKWLSKLNLHPMYLGLDLRGGVHFLLEIDMEGLISQLAESYADDLRTNLKDKKLEYSDVTALKDSIEITFKDSDELARARSNITTNQQSLQNLSWEVRGNTLIAKIPDTEINERKKNAVTQNISTLRNRVNELGVAEPVIQQQGLDRIVVQLPGVQDTARAKEILGTTATLEFRIVDERSQTEVMNAVQTGRAPLGTKLYYSRQNGQPYLLKRQVVLTGESIVNATAGTNPETNGAEVYITLDSKGADRFGVATKANIKKPMATVFIENRVDTVIENGVEVKKKVVTEEIANVATIQSQLFKNFSISGLAGLEEANTLAITLRSGALAAPIQIIEERTVGPSAGKDNIDKGMNAAIYGLLMVMVFMAFRYGAFGLIADVALVANLILILALLSLLQATLTLPGIAGIVLSLGMSVDANVLINERIREDLRKGMSPQNAINNGFSKAFGTIMDANLTSLFAALVLFLIGSGPIKGFAVTLTFGIITSVFTAVFMNRAIVNAIWGGRRNIKSLPIGGKERLKIFSGETTYNFMKLCKFWVISCIITMIVAIGITQVKGFNYGLDFTGGTEVQAIYPNSVSVDDVRDSLVNAKIDSAVVQHFGSSSEVLISLPTLEGQDEAALSNTILSALKQVDDKVAIKRLDFIGSKVGGELVNDGIMASVIAIILILLYIWVRFEWKLALGSILSTIHDTFFVIAAFSLLGLEFDLTSLAAILAVIGYSVNDTVVVLDRIRENFRSSRTGKPYEIVNAAINQTLSRTIMTSLTTFLAVLSLYIYGGPAIHSFSLIMLIGIVIGTYSSIFIAAAGALILGLKREDLLPPKKEEKEFSEIESF